MGYGHPFCYGILSVGFADFLFLPRATTISHGLTAHQPEVKAKKKDIVKYNRKRKKNIKEKRAKKKVKKKKKKKKKTSKKRKLCGHMFAPVDKSDRIFGFNKNSPH